MRITVDREICVGAGQCALVAENLFDQDDEGLVDLLEANPGPELEPAARRAESLCPAHAITVAD